ncbi:aromatase/cyclase [Streptomyces sp. NPDC048441]|uniref:aromatase/cyclase n=1 Tax=Streptomyces sp. NPDC048441 TaxID=3365552 RepID=UPI003712B166
MSVESVHSTAHEVTIEAPAGVVYALLADSTRWPVHLRISVHVEQLEFDGRHERTRMWTTTADGRVESWTSRRTFAPELHQIEFRQEPSSAPTHALSGVWNVEPLTAGRSKLTLRHSFTTVGADSGASLDSLRDAAELWPRLDELALSFEDSVRIDGPAEPAYDFLYRVQDWPGRVPGVIRADVTEDEPGVQLVSMDTMDTDGRVHTTRSVRICFPHAGRIIYKQLTASGLLSAHTGEWSVLPDATGTTVSAQQDVLLRAPHARRQVRRTLGRASTRVLALAKKHTQSAVRAL